MAGRKCVAGAVSNRALVLADADECYAEAQQNDVTTRSDTEQLVICLDFARRKANSVWNISVA